jgi:hypothetical protein
VPTIDLIDLPGIVAANIEGEVPLQLWQPQDDLGAPPILEPL